MDKYAIAGCLQGNIQSIFYFFRSINVQLRMFTRGNMQLIKKGRVRKDWSELR